MRYTYENVPRNFCPHCPECSRRVEATLITNHRQCLHTQCCNEDCQIEAFSLIWVYCKTCRRGGFLDSRVETRSL